jgi:RNA polymerase sigma-70 factor (ECF subfamily)
MWLSRALVLPAAILQRKWLGTKLWLRRLSEGIAGRLRLTISTEVTTSEHAVTADVVDKYASVKTQVNRLRQNEPDAWDELVQEWSARLFNYIRNSVPTREDAQDILSETFAAAVRSIHRFDGNVAMSTWLYALAHNKVVDFWRRTKIEQELSPTLSIADDEPSLDFQEAFGRLPEAARKVLQLRYVEGLGVDEIAQVLGRTYKATESLLSRSRSMLKSAMEEAELVQA